MKKSTFYAKDEKSGKVSINHSNLLNFLAEAGYGRVKQGKSYTLAHKKNNQLREVEASEISRYVQAKLHEEQTLDVLEVFVRGVGNFLTLKKLDLLPEIELINDRDDQDSSIFYFRNCFVEITKDRIVEKNYNTLKKCIWNSRIIRKKFRLAKAESQGQFEKFCWNISGMDDERFKQIKSMLGYLLHRHKNPALTKAIILYDENMHSSSGAEGGTGKTLISKALSYCRDVVVYNGKELKDGSWFKNQRIGKTTDLVSYDDVPSNFNFEGLFPILTTGIEIERKREHAFEIPFSESPKVLISSNYYVKGPGGSSDRRRRYEFELANYYNDKFTPRDDFGNLLFDEWDYLEWNNFFLFMMQCVQVFLNEGLIEGDTEGEVERTIIGKTSKEFYETISVMVEPGIIYDQREYVTTLSTDHPDLSSRLFSKWMKIYCTEKGLEFQNKSSAGKYLFWVTNKAE